MLYWGVRGLPVWRFLVLDLLGCAAWAALLVTIGFHTSDSATLLEGRARRAERWLLVALVTTVLTVVVVHRVARRRRERMLGRTPNAAADARHPPGS